MTYKCAAAKPDRAGELAIDSMFVGCRTSEGSLNGRFGRAGTFCEKMTIEEATRIAKLHLNEMVDANSKYPLSLFLNETTKIKNGWVFFYQSAEFVKTGNRDSFLFGNAPLIVDSRDGSIHVTGTSGKLETYIKNFEETGDLHVEAMEFVRLTGCRQGAMKIEGTKAILEFTDLGLARSKRCIDDALDGIPAEIQVGHKEGAKALCTALDRLGWDCSIIRRAK